MGKLYDCIIIGSGPAGLTAAIYAARACLSVLVLEKEFVSGGQVVNTYEVDNYPGYRGISGFDLGMKFREHAEKLDVEFVMEAVERVDLEKEEKIIYTDQSEYHGRTAWAFPTARPATGPFSREKLLPWWVVETWPLRMRSFSPEAVRRFI